ncbi:VOC family protein [Frigidibacter sp. MR17.24]|uniref:VOC family protein n=1 Tax=Frigidibacter sp. MR17.24 TaxID=3127345 RepID=UPI003012B3E9
MSLPTLEKHPLNTATAPIEIGHVVLTVRDLAGVGDYYRDVVGLEPIAEDGETRRFGAAGRTLVELRRDGAARIAPRGEAGLFHTAFLLPSRADLGRWLSRIADRQIPVQGASDHLVSEAVYLTDPEGNGIEVYADRDRDRADWPRGPQGIAMATEPMDVQGVLAAGRGGWKGLPAATVVGHVHLKVGDLGQTEEFFGTTMGLELTTRYPGANFWGWGGYHHHLATNIWQTRGAGTRQHGLTGLAEVVLLAEAPEAARLGARPLVDPWGTVFSVAPKA